MNQIHVLLSVKENEKLFRIDDLSLWKMVESHLSQVKILDMPKLKIHDYRRKQNNTIWVEGFKCIQITDFPHSTHD
jgi:hypothetical protein